MRRHRRRDDDGVERLVGEQVGVVGRRARVRVPSGEPGTQPLVQVAEPRELGELVEVADEVGAPVPEADDADPRPRR
jgi:hypothetical protein